MGARQWDWSCDDSKKERSDPGAINLKVSENMNG